MGISLLVPAVIVTVMIAIFWIGYFIEWRDFLKAKHWQSTSAIIVSSKPVGMSESGTFWPEIVYEFEYGGKMFKGRRIRFSGSRIAEDFRRATRGCEAFPGGRVLPVCFDPGKPERSVLMPRDKSGLFTMGVLLLALSFVPGFFWAFACLAR
jgi:hypothetical protein